MSLRSNDFPKIQCIKEVRQATDCGLKEAKEAVEEAMDLPHNNTFDDVFRDACAIVDPVHFSRRRIIEEPELDYKKMYTEIRTAFEYHTDMFVRDTLDKIHTAEENRVWQASLPYQLQQLFNAVLDMFEEDQRDLLRGIDDIRLVEDVMVDCIATWIRKFYAK